MYYHFSRDNGAKYCRYCGSVSVCISVYLSVLFLRLHVSKPVIVLLIQKSWSWLGLFLVAMQYVMYLRCFCITPHFSVKGTSGPESKTTRMFRQFTGGTRDEICRLRLHLVCTALVSTCTCISIDFLVKKIKVYTCP